MDKMTWNMDEKQGEVRSNRKKLSGLCNRFSIVLHLIACMGGYFVIEWISRHSFMEAWDYLFDRSWVFLYNSFLIFTTTMLAYLSKRRVFFRTVIASFWLLLGIINGILLTKRVTPFTGPDLKLFTEGLGVVSKYFDGGQIVLLIAGLAILVLGLVLLFMKGPKYQGKYNYGKSVLLIAGMGILLAVFTRIQLDRRLLSTYFGNIAFAYEDYGFPYCLSVTLFDTGVSEPTGYDKELINRIELESEGKVEQEEMPNVIAIQLETFFDPTQVRFLKFSEDPIPYFRSLMKKYSSGYYTVPSVGAGTANTEFETLTGMSMRFFGAGEYPYKGILSDETCESAAYIFDSLGYASHAIHNNEANFYSRRAVFANLGFDTFTSSEYMNTQNDTNPTGWMRDRNLIGNITDALDSTEKQDFVFTVSVQGHGNYPEEPALVNPKIKVSGAAAEEKNCAWEYYVNQLHEMDAFIKALIEKLEQRDEKTVLFLYGDHLPTMGLKDEDLKSGDLFKTKYVMWDNIGLDRQKKNICAYQAMAEIMNRIGIHRGVMFNLHQQKSGDPLYQIDIQTLMYDMLYGRKYVFDEENPYEKKKLHLGIKDAYVTGIEKLNETMYFVRGGNFTQSSKAEVGGEILDTAYIADDLLLVKNAELETGTWINVAQQSNSSTAKVLSRTNKIVYWPPKQ